MSEATVADWLRLVHEHYPPAHARSWDNVGLQVGDPSWPVRRVLVSLDVTSAVLDEALEEPGTLLLAHHPLLFRPLASVTPSTPSGRLALRAAAGSVAVAAAHTNLDVSQDGAGTSTPVARVLDLQDTRPLDVEVGEGDRVKLIAFVPPESVDAVIDGMSAAGAGLIGDYDRCSFRVRGTGTFRPLDGADPYSGTVGEVAEEAEDRVEVEVPRALVGEVVRALIEAHPYEEVAYDLVPLLDGETVGLGLVGDLPAPLTLDEVAAIIRADLPAFHLRYAGDPAAEVRRVAVVGGAGDSLIGAALRADADVYVTGDLRHHVTLDAVEQGLALIDAGHHATEVAAIPAWVEQLTSYAERRGLRAPVVASSTPTVPWR